MNQKLSHSGDDGAFVGFAAIAQALDVSGADRVCVEIETFLRQSAAQ